MHLPLSRGQCWLSSAHTCLLLEELLSVNGIPFPQQYLGGYPLPRGQGEAQPMTSTKAWTLCFKGRGQLCGDFPVPELPVGSGRSTVPNLSQFSWDSQFSVWKSTSRETLLPGQTGTVNCPRPQLSPYLCFAGCPASLTPVQVSLESPPSVHHVHEHHPTPSPPLFPTPTPLLMFLPL